MSRGALLVLPAVLAATGGCVGPFGRDLRPVSLELEGEQGRWRLDGVQQLALQRLGWEVRILESRVNAAPYPPRLEKLVLQIKNTAEGLPLHVGVMDVSLAGMAGEPAVLAPPQNVTLSGDETLNVVYDPGVYPGRAPLLPYPFRLRVAASRDGEAPEEVVLVLY